MEKPLIFMGTARLEDLPYRGKTSFKRGLYQRGIHVVKNSTTSLPQTGCSQSLRVLLEQSRIGAA